MAITSGGSSAAVYGANSITLGIPGHAAGDLLVAIGGGKPFDLGWSVSTSGWVALGSGASGNTAAGVDTGSMKMQVWYNICDSASETGPTITEGTPVWNVAGGGVLKFAKAANEEWVTPVVVYGADEVNGTSISVTFASNPAVTAGDYVITACAMNTDALGPLTTNLTAAQTGVTFGSPVQEIDSESTTGGDMALYVGSQSVIAGTGSAAPTATGTGTASGGADRVEACFIRLRVTVVTKSLPFSRRDTLIVPII